MVRLKTWFANLKIKQKILVFSIVLMLFVTSVFVWFSSRIVENMVLDKLEQTNQRSMDAIDSYFTKIDGILTGRLKHIETGINVLNLLKGETYTDISALLSDVMNVDFISGIELYNMEGKMVSSIKNLDPDTVPELTGQIMAEATVNTNYWYNQDFNNVFYIDAIPVFRAIEHEGEVVGFIKAMVDTSALTDVYNYVGFNISSEICLISGQEGRESLILPKSVDTSMLQMSRECLKKYRENGSGEDLSIKHTFSGEKYILYGRYLDNYQIFITSISKYGEVIQETTIIKTVIYILGGVSLILILLFCTLMADSVSRPILKLAKNMQEVSNGNLAIRMNDPSKNEIGILSQNFDSMLDRLVKLMNEIDMVQKRKHQLELTMLQMQITPHFLYNSLESVSSLALIGDNETAYKMSGALSMFYRGILSDGRSIIRISEELEIAKNYLEVQSIRYKDIFTYEINVPKEILEGSIVKLTIQPLVENAIYHGVRAIRRRGKIKIEGYVGDNEIVICVKDNGKGMASPEKLMQSSEKKGDLIFSHHGFGMSNVDQRFKLYFGEQYGLKITSKPGKGTCVEVHLPFIAYEGNENDFGFNRR
jgi:two-component system sensor histidine kinase YesM